MSLFISVSTQTYFFLPDSSAGVCSDASFFSLLLSRFLAEGLLDFLSLGDLGDLGDLERPDLERLDLGRSDLALSRPSSAGGGLDAVSLSDLSGDSALSTGSLKGKKYTWLFKYLKFKHPFSTHQRFTKYRTSQKIIRVHKEEVKYKLLFLYLFHSLTSMSGILV